MSHNVKSPYPGVEARIESTGTTYTARIQVGRSKVRLFKSSIPEEAAYAFAVAFRRVHPDRPGSHLADVTDRQVSAKKKQRISEVVDEMLDAALNAGTTNSKTSRSKATSSTTTADQEDRLTPVEELIGLVFDRDMIKKPYIYAGTFESELRNCRRQNQELLNALFRGRPGGPKHALNKLLERKIRLVVTSDERLLLDLLDAIDDEVSLQLEMLSWPIFNLLPTDPRHGYRTLEEELKFRYPDPFARSEQRKAKRSGYRFFRYDDPDPDWNFFGLARTCTLEEAKRARNKLLASSHPDRGGSHDDAVKVNLEWEKVEQFFRSA